MAGPLASCASLIQPALPQMAAHTCNNITNQDQYCPAVLVSCKGFHKFKVEAFINICHTHRLSSPWAMFFVLVSCSPVQVALINRLQASSEASKVGKTGRTKVSSSDWHSTISWSCTMAACNGLLLLALETSLVVVHSCRMMMYCPRPSSYRLARAAALPVPPPCPPVPWSCLLSTRALHGIWQLFGAA